MVLAVDYYQMLSLFQVFYKQRDTHCLSNDASNAWLASESWQTLETNKEFELKENTLFVHKCKCMSDKKLKKEGVIMLLKLLTLSPTDPIGPGKPLRPRGP